MPSTKEPQYNRCLLLKRESLGLMTNQVWHDDPKRLVFTLARYKFVAKMLSGKKFVAEVGCGDAFGARIVSQEIDSAVTAYDFDPVFIQDINRRNSGKWPINARLHDVAEYPMPKNLYDGVYSLDVIEHISKDAEGYYLLQLRETLTDKGVLIIGTPSIESQKYASPMSEAGHINCKSGEELRALLKKYFHNVFLFSMNDEVVHTGFSPMAHYLFVVCCQKRAP